MKAYIFLIVCGLATVSLAFPPLLPIARSTTDPRREDPALQREAIRILTENYATAPESNGVDDRRDLLVWLIEKPGETSKELTPLLITVLNTEPSESVRLLAIKGLGTAPESKEVTQAILQQLNPAKHPPFPVFTSVREEAARSLGKQSRALSEESSVLKEHLSVLDKAVVDPLLLTGAIDGISLCGMEKKVVREHLSRILNNRSTNYPELTRIRIIQWYRHEKLSYPGMAEDLHAVVSSGIAPQVRLSAIQALFVGRKANASTSAALATIIRGRQVKGEVLVYARNLRTDAEKAGDLIHPGPLIEEICRDVLGNS